MSYYTNNEVYEILLAFDEYTAEEVRSKIKNDPEFMSRLKAEMRDILSRHATMTFTIGMRD